LVGSVNLFCDDVSTYTNPLKSSTQSRKTQPDQKGNQTLTTNGQRGIQRGERESGTREDPTRPQGRTRPPLPTDRERFREDGEGETGGSQDERRPNPIKKPDPYYHNGQRGIQRGERLIWGE